MPHLEALDDTSLAADSSVRAILSDLADGRRGVPGRHFRRDGLREAAARRAHGAAGRVTAAGTDAVPQNGVLRQHSREHPDTSAAPLAAHSNSPISDIMSSSVEGLF